MQWVYPQFLFALAVLLIPLLIHLFHFRRYRTVFFSSLTFLKSVEQNRQSVRKLKYWIIFACRALAFTFLVFAFAQPYFPSTSSGSKNEIVCFYIDNSFSMQRLGENGELLSEACDIVRSTAKDAPANSTFLLLTNELEGTQLKTLTRAQLIEAIDQVKPTPLVRKASDILNFWNNFKLQAGKSGQLIYISDFQASTFGNPAHFDNWTGKLYPVQLKPVNDGNLYIDSIWFASPVQKKGEKQTLFARLRNDGNENFESVDVNIRTQSFNRDLFARIPAKGTDTIELTYFNSQFGLLQATVNVNDRQMTSDDNYYFSYESRDNCKVLIVNGPDAVPNVSLVYGLDSYYVQESTGENQLSQGALTAMDLVVLNGLNQVSGEQIELLSGFAENGGTVLCLPGTNAGITGWNSLLSKLHLPELIQLQKSESPIRNVNTADHFYDGVFRNNPREIHLPAVSGYYQLKKSTNTQAIDLLTLRNGNSFFVRSTGKQKAYLCASPLSPDFSSFTSNQLFSTFLLRIGETSQQLPPYYLVIGNDGSYPLNTNIGTDQAVHLRRGSIDFIPRIFTRQNRSWISLQGLETVKQLVAGNYEVVLEGKQIGGLSVNYNRSESRTAALSAEDINTRFASAGIDVAPAKDLSGWQNAGMLQIDQEQSWWKFCVFLVLVFLFAEMTIIYFWKQ